jgi:hypothetical protein
MFFDNLEDRKKKEGRSNYVFVCTHNLLCKHRHVFVKAEEEEKTNLNITADI